MAYLNLGIVYAGQGKRSQAEEVTLTPSMSIFIHYDSKAKIKKACTEIKSLVSQNIDNPARKCIRLFIMQDGFF